MLKHAKKVAAAATLVGVAGMASVAYAAWTADGSGTGAGGAKTEAPVTVGNAPASGPLCAGANGDIVVTITNPNPYRVVVSDVYHGALTDITSTNVGCTAAN